MLAFVGASRDERGINSKHVREIGDCQQPDPRLAGHAQITSSSRQQKIGKPILSDNGNCFWSVHKIIPCFPLYTNKARSEESPWVGCVFLVRVSNGGYFAVLRIG